MPIFHFILLVIRAQPLFLTLQYLHIFDNRNVYIIKREEEEKNI